MNTSFRASPRLAVFLALTLAALLPRAFADSETMSERTLKQIVSEQKALLADAEKQGDKLDTEAFRAQVQELCHEYELLLHGNPNFAEAYMSYGYLLSKMDMPKEAVALLLKANQLNPDIPLVKNQIGNYLAEEGKPLEALNYYLAAIKLDPTEPLYHYQLGLLLYAARSDFITSGDWTREQIDDTSHNAFKRAAELAPDQYPFTYRYAESFADLQKPQWDEALKAWAVAEESTKLPVERELARLQAANILIKQGRFDHARLMLSTVTDPATQQQKQKLVAQLPPLPAN